MSEKTKKTSSDGKLGSKLKGLLSNVTVEPHVFCNFLAISFITVASHSGLYEVICVQNFQDSLGVHCTHEGLRARPDVETKVQRLSSNVNMYLSLAYLIPAIFADIFLGAWADINGRKFNIILGLGGLIVACFPLTIVFTFPRTPLFILAIANFISGITGHVGIIMITSLAYLTDVVVDHSKLTTRMAIVFVFSNLAGAIGSFVVGSLVKVISFAHLILIAIIILTIGFFYAFFRIPMIPPVINKKIMEAKAKGQTYVPQTPQKPKTELVSKKSCANEPLAMIKLIGQMYKEFWHTFTRVRKGHRRGYIYLMTVVYLLLFIAELGLLHSPVISLFVFHHPFYWNPDQLAYWKGAQSLFLTFGNFVGSLVMKNLLHFKETTIILICLASGIANLLMTAFSATTWQLYLAIALGCLANLAVPSIKSFIAQSVDADEVGKAFTANGVTVDIALVLSTILFNSIYSATVSYFPGAVFLLAVGLLVGCWIIVLGVHIDAVITEKSNDDVHNDAKKPIENGNPVTRL